MKRLKVLLATLSLGAGGLLAAFLFHSGGMPAPAATAPRFTYGLQPRKAVDTNGVHGFRRPPVWEDPTSLEDIRQSYVNLAQVNLALVDQEMSGSPQSQTSRLQSLFSKAAIYMFDGDPTQTYELLQEARSLAESSASMRDEWLYTVIFFQGVAGLRRGENENCLDCRGAGACIFPLAPTAVHTSPAGSRAAIKHFTEYLQRFPDDLEVRWLLNLAHMTLGEHPDRVPPEHLLKFDKFGAEDDIGRFQDISHKVGVNRINLSGGGVMDDFDNDGLLDVAVTSFTQAAGYFRNKGDGTFDDRTEVSGLGEQYCGFNLVQTDYDNDGYLDLYIPRAGWFHLPKRPSLLHNNGNGTFADVTREAGLMQPGNSPGASWADFDNDGYLDLFVCSEVGPNRLHRQRGDGTFEEVAAKAGVQNDGAVCKGAAWIDYDNNSYPDLFLTYIDRTAQLYHNNGDGRFTDVTGVMGVNGPMGGFSCWAFDYDNDGWLDIFATCYLRSLENVVGGMLGHSVQPAMDRTRLYRNLGGKRFQDVSKETGVDKVFTTMGSNFGDFDNDGYLDFYLGTGDPYYYMLVPNRMFRNQEGQRFADITTTSGTGHLQKGHGTACGDWDRDGNIDLFVEMGGAAPGDPYHNVLFQNPGQGNNWLTLKLVGKKTNRAAIGARIKVVTAGAKPQTVHRHVSSGSSFGGNPLQQTIGLGKASAATTVEIFWPTSQTTQVFHDLAVNQTLEITEFAKEYRKLNWTRVPMPRE